MRLPRVALMGSALCGRTELLRSISRMLGSDLLRLNERVPASHGWEELDATLLATSTGRAVIFCAPGGSPPNLLARIVDRSNALVHCINAQDGGNGASVEFFESYREIIIPKRRIVVITKVDIQAPRVEELVVYRIGEITTLQTSSRSGRGIGELISAIGGLFDFPTS